jgi:hypothetical protein
LEHEALNTSELAVDSSWGPYHLSELAPFDDKARYINNVLFPRVTGSNAGEFSMSSVGVVADITAEVREEFAVVYLLKADHGTPSAAW